MQCILFRPPSAQSRKWPRMEVAESLRWLGIEPAPLAGKQDACNACNLTLAQAVAPAIQGAIRRDSAGRLLRLGSTTATPTRCCDTAAGARDWFKHQINTRWNKQQELQPDPHLTPLGQAMERAQCESGAACSSNCCNCMRHLGGSPAVMW
jgi:hypothetical protein